jgi:putative ABC transport system permease protein
MGQAIRERTSELATLKVLGFGNGGLTTLVLCESLLITAIGGGAGLALSYALVDVLKPQLVRYFSTFGFSDLAVVIGIGLIVFFGVICGLLPALEVARMRTVNALRKA